MKPLFFCASRLRVVVPVIGNQLAMPFPSNWFWRNDDEASVRNLFVFDHCRAYDAARGPIKVHQPSTAQYSAGNRPVSESPARGGQCAEQTGKISCGRFEDGH